MSDPNAENAPTDPGYQPSPLAEVGLTKSDARWTLTFTRDFGHPVLRVWEALTEPGQLRHWAPFTPDRDLAATGDIVLTMQDEKGNDAEGEGSRLPGTVTVSRPPKVLAYTWGADALRWDLTSTDDGTTLTLSQTFTDGQIATSLAAGWHICLDVLDAMMKDVPFGPVLGNRALEFGWDDLNRQYAKLLGVEPVS